MADAGDDSAWLVALDGPTGAGKTTVARELARSLGGIVVDEAYDRLGRRPDLAATAPSALYATEEMLLDEEARRFAEARLHRDEGTHVVLDTGVLGPLSYSFGLRELGLGPDDLVARLARRAEELLAGEGYGLPDLTIYLDVDADVLAWRAGQDADRHPPALLDRHWQVARVERPLFLHGFPRYLPGRFATVDGDGSPERVVERIRELLDLARPVEPTDPGETRRLLVLFEERAPAGGGAFGPTG